MTWLARADRLRLGLLVFGGYQVAIGLFQLVAPGVFFEEVGPFGVRNDHYTRDGATWELALGVALLASVRLPSWRVPLLVMSVVHFALHTANHLVDVSEADPSWVGPVDAALLALGTLLLWALLAGARRREREESG